jgi:AcrR family transcriptional regulator
MGLTTTPRRRRVAPGTDLRDDPRAAELRAVILDLVARLGYDRVTIDSIAIEAKASKTTMYKRWPSKAALVIDAVRDHAATLLTDPGDSGRLRDDMLAIVSQTAAKLNGEIDLVIGLLGAARRDEQLMTAVAGHIRGPAETIGRLPIQRAIARGELPPDTNTLLIAEVAMPMLMHRALWREPLDDAFVTHVVDDVLLPLLLPAEAQHEAE